jgi:hypothetical protein
MRRSLQLANLKGANRSNVYTGKRILFHSKQNRIAGGGPAEFDPVARPGTLAGTTTHFNIYYANVFGASGDKIAQGVLEACERDYEILAGYFGLERSLQFNVILAPLSPYMDGTGGSYHDSCVSTNLYCDVQISPKVNPEVSNAVLVAAVVDVFAAMQKGGWNCGNSNGEGLSRVLAAQLHPGALEGLGYLSAPAWLNSPRPNYVARTHPTDRYRVANGCSILFLNYLHFQLGFGWDKICQAAAQTLAGTYQALTGKSQPFPGFSLLLNRKFPPGQLANLLSENPFPIHGVAQAGSLPTVNEGESRNPRVLRSK